jgi:uncharacterized phosphosugar-binding protein
MTAYFDRVRALLTEAERKNAGAMEQAADLIAKALASGGLLHTFGTGHGHLLAEELFYRAGSLAPVNAILDPSLMLHVSATGSTAVERLSGYAEPLLARYDVKAGDVLLIASNSGRNSVPIEMALAAQGRGLKVIALTSLAHSCSQPSRHASGQRLFEIADVVLDNCGDVGDAAIEIDGLPGKIGATSTVIGAAILHALVCRVVEKMLERGAVPPTTLSANVNGGDEHNARILSEYRSRIKHL